MPGAVLFARYAYPPNALGLCGPDDHQALLEYGDEGVSDPGLEHLARGFDGAWPYLELIAAAGTRADRGVGPGDPLDRAVVEAYWIGGSAADRVAPASLVRSLDDRFRRRAGANWNQVLAAVVAGLPVCHAFHVFAVYPWTGLLRSGASDRAVQVLDQCRIRAGEVVEVDGDSVVVRTRRLSWNGDALDLGPPSVEVATWRRSGRGPVAELAAGDTVALHWDWVCDRLTEAQRARLAGDTNVHLQFVNAWSRRQWREGTFS